MLEHTTLRTMPASDLIEHDADALCVCGPDTEYVIGAGGDTGKLVIHHALDGREGEERDRGAPR